MRFRWVLPVATVMAVAVAVAGSAQARPARSAAHAADEQKRFCVGIDLDPWHIPYDGKCRFGSALGPMRAAVGLLGEQMGVLQQGLIDRGVGDARRARLLDQIQAFRPLTAQQGQRRLKRAAGKGRKSGAARDAVNCAVFGSLAAGLKLLEELAFDQQLPQGEGPRQERGRRLRRGARLTAPVPVGQGQGLRDQGLNGETPLRRRRPRRDRRSRLRGRRRSGGPRPTGQRPRQRPGPGDRSDAAGSGSAPAQRRTATAPRTVRRPAAVSVSSQVPVAAGRAYVVRAGDTLSGIAARFGTSWQALAAINRLHAFQHAGMTIVLIYPGERIRLR